METILWGLVGILTLSTGLVTVAGTAVTLLGFVVMGQPEVYFQFKPGLIDEHFEVTDDQSRAFLEGFVASFVAWIERHGSVNANAIAAE